MSNIAIMPSAGWNENLLKPLFLNRPPMTGERPSESQHVVRGGRDQTLLIQTDPAHKPVATQSRRPLYQASVWVGMIVLLVVVLLLLLDPDFGLQVLWSAVVFAAPMLFLLVPAFWMSVCPLATLQALPRRLGLDPSRRVSPRGQVILATVAWGLFVLLVPLRHPIFNIDGTAALLAIGLLGVVALGSGFLFRGMGGWCSGVCPIRPVEILYGQFTVESHRPETCRQCAGCVRACPWLDSSNVGQHIAGSRFTLLAALGFPGFVLGYFLVEDGASAAASYAYAWGGWAASMALFFALGTRLGPIVLLRLAALSAFAIYYAMSIPRVAATWELGSMGPLLLALLPTTAMVLAVVGWVHRSTPVRTATDSSEAIPSALRGVSSPPRPPNRAPPAKQSELRKP